MSGPASYQWYQLEFPNLVEPDQLLAFLRAVHGTSSPKRRVFIVFQVVGRAGRIEHYLRLPLDRANGVIAQAVSIMPGLVLHPVEHVDVGQPQAAWRLWLSTSRRPLRSDEPAAISLGVLTALASARADEVLVLQWLIGPVRRPLVVAAKHSPMLSESWPIALATAPLLPPGELDSEARRALRLKQSEPGWRAVGRIAVQAASRTRGLTLRSRVLGALRTAEGPGAALGVRPVHPNKVTEIRTPWFWGLALNVRELTALAGWPLGDLPVPPVAQRRSRLLPVPETVPRRGRVLADEPHSARPIALSTRDSLHHLWVLGPTGTGKSTLLLNLIEQAMTAGHSVFVAEPKGDLIANVLACVPGSRESDVVWLDPSDLVTVGLNPLAANGPADLIADQLLTIFARLNSDSWGPRLAELLHTALLTLARTPAMSLAALPPLLTNDHFRRRIVGTLDDPLGVSPIWAAYERLSEEARTQAVAAVLNKVRVLTARPMLRAVLGQVSPRFALSDLFSSRRPILLANLAKGVIGPDSSRLLGTLLLNQLWQTALGRSAVPPERRHVVSVFIDELQDYAALPGDLGDMLAQARGLGVAFTVANQHLDQLSPSLRSGLLTNARSRVIFQTAADDARVLARGHSEITPEDFTRLDAHEVYLRLSVGAAVTPYMSGRTRPAPTAVSDPAVIRQLSRERYGVPASQTDADLRALIEGPAGSERPIGRVRRSV